MSNLKKILALVLALVMSFSLVSVSSAAYADYTDLNEIDPAYAEAVEVLTGIGIFQGDNGAFKPKSPITRQEVAAMMYRVISTDVTDKNDGLYVDACNFTDVTANWAKGYIGYCANGGYIKGVGDNKFNPQGNISGVAVLAMILRAVGYDKNNEFTGSDWDYNVLSVATSLGILSGIDETVESLKKDASRELVAQLIFNAMVKAQKVNYTPAFGYQPIVTVLKTGTTIGKDNFNLTKGSRTEVDDWGRPGYYWYGEYNNVAELQFSTTDVHYATIEEAYYAAHNTATADCTIAHDRYGKSINKNFSMGLWVNGVKGTTTIDFDNTAAVRGGQGTILEVYADRVVVIDTYLAKVGNVYPAVKDYNGHTITKAYSDLTIYGECGKTALVEYTTLPLLGNDYAKGDMILVHVLETETNPLYMVDAIGLATAFEGTQSTIWMNAHKHTVNGADYNDAKHFHLDEAGYETTNHVWYQDQFGNLIGVADIDTIYSYGVITNLYWANDATNFGKGAAYATIKYMDGTDSGVVVVNRYNDCTPTYARDMAAGYADLYDNTTGVATPDKKNDTFYVSTYGYDNSDFVMDNLMKIETLADGSVRVWPCSKTADADSTIITGVSKVGNETLYADNYTQYLIYNPATLTWSTVTGYDNVGTYKNIDFCYQNNVTNTFMKYVFINGLTAGANAADFVYITNRGAAINLKSIGGVQYFVVSGIIRDDGTTAAVEVAATAAGTVEKTLEKLTEWVKNVGKLYKVPTYNGRVVDFSAITEVTTAGTAIGGLVAEHEGVPTNYTENGVLILDGVYYNVNTTTTIINEYGIGNTTDLKAAVVNGKNIYVVYSTSMPTTAIAVFVTDQAGKVPTPANAIAAALADYEAAIGELNAAIKAAKNMDGYYGIATVTNEYVTAYENIKAAEKKVADKLTALNDAITAEETAIGKVDTTKLTADELEAHNDRIALKNHQKTTLKTDVEAAKPTVATISTVLKAVIKAGVEALVEDYKDVKALKDATDAPSKAAYKAVADQIVLIYPYVDVVGLTADLKNQDGTVKAAYADFVEVGKTAETTAVAAAKAAAAETLKALAAEKTVELANKKDAEGKQDDALIYVTLSDTNVAAVVAAKITAATAMDFTGATTVAAVNAVIADKADEVAAAAWAALKANGEVKKAAAELIQTWVVEKNFYTAEWAVIEEALEDAIADIKALDSESKTLGTSITTIKTTFAKVVATQIAKRIGTTLTVEVAKDAELTVADVKAAAKKLAKVELTVADVSESLDTITYKAVITVGPITFDMNSTTEAPHFTFTVKVVEKDAE